MAQPMRLGSEMLGSFLLRMFLLFSLIVLGGCVPEGSLNSGIYKNVSDETLCWQAENGLEAETKFERMKRFLNCDKVRARPEALGRTDEAKFQSLPESEKISRSSDVRICAFAVDGGSWAMDRQWQGYVEEAKHRGLDCGITEGSNKQITNAPKPSMPRKPEQISVSKSQSRIPAEATIAKYEQQFGPADDTESYEENLVMKFCKTGMFEDDFVYLWIRSGSVVTVKKEAGSRPGSCARNYKLVDWSGTVAQGFLVLRAPSRKSGGGWDAVAEEFLIQQQRSQQELNKSLMDSFENNRINDLDALERNRSIDCAGRGGTYIRGVCRF